ncbi:16S rRNA processing protein RimM [candidate division TA06 bacterium]|uniref:Ribosome maturation factor RimM n=1 Tax=candidate division TA06 bacterium TaxID=2250710 RepID=A0A660SIB7_UNCT6|nr:MAG: 16S rRNA processing protein RimM [candidate division TA06 bacterium]
MREDINIGIIGKTHGIQGYFRVKSLSDFPERFIEMSKLRLKDKNEERIYDVEDVLIRNNQILIKVKGVDSREDAINLNGQSIVIDISERMKLKDDTYYINNLIGMHVYSKKGDTIGEVFNIINNGANDILVIKNGNNEILIPMINQFVKSINIKNREIIITPIEGLIDVH